MKTLALAVVTMSVALASQASIILNFSGNGENAITFQGTGKTGEGQFSLSPYNSDVSTTPNYQFTVTDSSTASKSAVNLKGYFVGGPWTYSGITTIDTDGGYAYWQQADVSGTSKFVIDDGTGKSAIGNLSWGKIQTIDAGGWVNMDASLNVSAMAYSGANSDLLTLVNSINHAGILTLSFHWTVGPRNLEQLAGATPQSTSFSGQISSVPEATTVLAGAGALAMLLLGVGRGASRSKVIRIGK